MSKETHASQPNIGGARFWETKTLEELSPTQWEALCDGCGKCCLNKLEDWETGEIHWTNVACQLFDDGTCQCSNYANRFATVPDCVQLTPEVVREVTWLPETCAYARIRDGRDLPEWHYLKTDDRMAVHRANASAQDKTVSEQNVTVEEYEDFLVDIEKL